MERRILFILTLLLLPAIIAAQKYHTSSSRAMGAFAAAKQDFDFLYFDSAEKKLKEAISADRKFFEAHRLLGDLYYKIGKYSESAVSYRNAIRIDSVADKFIFFNAAEAELKTGDYKRALSHYRTFLAFKPAAPKNEKIAEKNIINCEFAINAILNPVPYNPSSMGDSINTGDDEYWPSITADGKIFMFTKQTRNQRQGSRNQEDFWFSEGAESYWKKAKNAGAPLNTSQNEGAQTLSSDGTYMFFTACDRPGGAGRCDIWYSSFDGIKWSGAQNLGAPVNTAFWESQPSVTSNGRMLFFASNRPGGIGGMDIWFSVKDKSGKWKSPRNLGPLVNSPGDEMSPFIHFDNQTLYFSSDGRPGMGGHDLYLTKMNTDTSWTLPSNLGYPINTWNDEMGLVIDASGTNAFFSTKRDDIRGKDIFTFALYEAVRPNPVSYFRGIVSDNETGKLLKAEFELVNLNTGKLVNSGFSDSKGDMLVCLPSGFNYGLNVSKPGYLFYSDNFMLEGVHSSTEPFEKSVRLKQVKTGQILQLSNVFYEFNSWEIKKESETELERLHKLLSDNVSLIVEIGGYTDSVGTDTYNKTLSERRALSVMNYLTERGISSGRLKYRGYGSSSPIADNITEEGRKQNRRTEVRILSADQK